MSRCCAGAALSDQGRVNAGRACCTTSKCWAGVWMGACLRAGNLVELCGACICLVQHAIHMVQLFGVSQAGALGRVCAGPVAVD
jgi:hypothetical protein